MALPEKVVTKDIEKTLRGNTGNYMVRSFKIFTNIKEFKIKYINIFK